MNLNDKIEYMGTPDEVEFLRTAIAKLPKGRLDMGSLEEVLIIEKEKGKVIISPKNIEIEYVQIGGVNLVWSKGEEDSFSFQYKDIIYQVNFKPKELMPCLSIKPQGRLYNQNSRSEPI